MLAVDVDFALADSKLSNDGRLTHARIVLPLHGSLYALVFYGSAYERRLSCLFAS